MPAVGELLERFRHVGAPGAPAPSGAVPADATASLEAELRPLIAAVDELNEEAEAVVREAEAEAASIREAGSREAEEIVERGRRQASALRVGARASDPDDEDEEQRALLARADAQAEQIRRRAGRVIPHLAARVARCVQAGPGPVDAGLAVPGRELEDVAGLGRR